MRWFELTDSPADQRRRRELEETLKELIESKPGESQIMLKSLRVIRPQSMTYRGRTFFAQLYELPTQYIITLAETTQPTQNILKYAVINKREEDSWETTRNEFNKLESELR